MKHRPFTGIVAAVSFVLLTAAAPNSPDATQAAKPIPRLASGKPDFNGTWDNGAGIDFIRPQKMQDGSICVSGCAPQPQAGGAPAAPRPAPARPKYKPQFLAKVKDLEQRQVEMDPVIRCKSPGLPRIGPPDKIVQTEKEIVFLYDDV